MCITCVLVHVVPLDSYFFLFFKQKTAYEMPKCLDFRRVLFRSNYRRDIRQVCRPLLKRIILRQLSAQRQLAPQLRHLLYLLAKIALGSQKLVPRTAVHRALARKSYRRMPVHETSLSLSTLSGTAPSGQGRPSSPDPTPPRAPPWRRPARHSPRRCCTPGCNGTPSRESPSWLPFSRLLTAFESPPAGSSTSAIHRARGRRIRTAEGNTRSAK